MSATTYMPPPGCARLTAPVLSSCVGRNNGLTQPHRQVQLLPDFRNSYHAHAEHQADLRWERSEILDAGLPPPTPGAAQGLDGSSEDFQARRPPGACGGGDPFQHTAA